MLKGHSGSVTAVQFSPDGSKLASASRDAKVIMWNSTNGTAQCTLEGHWGWVEVLQFSPDGSKPASTTHNGKVIMWDLATGTKQHAGLRQVAGQQGHYTSWHKYLPSRRLNAWRGGDTHY